MQPEPGVAESWDISDDGRTYTFHLRQDARWSNGEPVTAHDFLYSLRRLLDPLTASRYAYLAWYIKNAKRYSAGGSGHRARRPGRSRAESAGRRARTRSAAKLLLGKLVRIEGIDGRRGSRAARPRVRRRHRRPRAAIPSGRRRRRSLPTGVEPCRQVLLDFREVGIRVIDDHTLEIRAREPDALLARSAGVLSALRRCIKAASKSTARRPGREPENIVTNGAFLLHGAPPPRSHSARARATRTGTAKTCACNVIDALSIDDRTTAVNLYLTGKADWVTVPPPVVLRELLAKQAAAQRLEAGPAADDVLLPGQHDAPAAERRARSPGAVAGARSRRDHARGHGGRRSAGLQPGAARRCPATSGSRARRAIRSWPASCLAEAGYPGGRGFPKLEIHYNTDQGHQAIAELVRKQWQRELGITVTLRNEEWASAQNTQQQMDYMLSRRAWIGDYLDPNTYLDMFVTGGENNSTGFCNAEYDKLIADAAREPDEAKRMQMLERAERILMDELPIIPIYLLRLEEPGEAVRPRLVQQSAGHPSAQHDLDRPHRRHERPAAERILAGAAMTCVHRATAARHGGHAVGRVHRVVPADAVGARRAVFAASGNLPAGNRREHQAALSASICRCTSSI